METGLYAADEHTVTQTDADERFTPATLVGVSNKPVSISCNELYLMNTSDIG